MILEYQSSIQSAMHSWDARWKLFVLGAGIFTAASVQKIYSIIIIVLLSITVVILSKIPIKIFIKSLKAPFIFLIIMFPVIAITSGGETLYSFGVITVYKTGLITGGIIAVRALSIISVSIIIFSTTKLNVLVKAMNFYKIPASFCAILIFTYRYIFLYFENLEKLLLAAKLRGYRLTKGIKHIDKTVNILVTLLIRSYEQSDRIYYAMQLRGFSGSFPIAHTFSTHWTDILKSVIFLLLIILTLGIEFV